METRGGSNSSLVGVGRCEVSGLQNTRTSFFKDEWDERFPPSLLGVWGKWQVVWKEVYKGEWQTWSLVR